LINQAIGAWRSLHEHNIYSNNSIVDFYFGKKVNYDNEVHFLQNLHADFARTGTRPSIRPVLLRQQAGLLGMKFADAGASFINGGHHRL
jgi:hypothetical protein